MKRKIWIWIVSVALAVFLFWVYRQSHDSGWIELEEERTKKELRVQREKKQSIEDEKERIENQRKELKNEDARRLRRLWILDRYRHLSK